MVDIRSPFPGFVDLVRRARQYRLNMTRNVLITRPRDGRRVSSPPSTAGRIRAW